jgi:hypothetical protein
MATFEDALSTDLDTGPESEFSGPYYSSSPPWRLECSEPEAFGLVGDDLVFLSADSLQTPSPEHSETTTVASEIGADKILQERNDQVFKSIRTADGVCRRMPNFFKSKTKRPKLGFAFSDFLLANADQDKDDFLTTLGRDFIKKICFCVGAEKLGFEKVFKESAKLHSSGTKNVKVPASETTKTLYKRLFSLYLTIPDRKILHFYGRSISDIKKDKNYKSFNVEFQRFVYTPWEMRLFYRYYVEFLDWFGQEGNGRKLRQEMRFKTEKTRVVKEEMIYGYLQALELRPADKLTEKEIFKVELDTR